MIKPHQTVVVSVSGGKDSTAAALHLREQGIPYRAVHLDTGWEHPDTMRYVREELPRHIGPIEIAAPRLDMPDAIAPAILDLEARYLDAAPSAMLRAIARKAMFPSRMRRWCTEELKVFPFQRWLEGSGLALEDVVNVVGVRAEESTARSKLPEWDADDSGYWVWRPLLGWSLGDVIAIHHRHGVQPNPLYSRGSARVGCWPCIFARKAEIHALALSDERRVAMIAELEAIITAAAKERAESRSADFVQADGHEKFRTFFGNPSYRKEVRDLAAQAERVGHPDPEQYAKDRARAQAPIAEVVRWATTDRDGEDIDPPDPRDTGCTRWGFCDLGGYNPRQGRLF